MTSAATKEVLQYFNAEYRIKDLVEKDTPVELFNFVIDLIAFRTAKHKFDSLAASNDNRGFPNVNCLTFMVRLSLHDGGFFDVTKGAIGHALTIQYPPPQTLISLASHFLTSDPPKPKSNVAARDFLIVIAVSLANLLGKTPYGKEGGISFVSKSLDDRYELGSLSMW